MDRILENKVMGHFYANIQGNRSEATRMGGKDSGIRGHIRGWEGGGRVACQHEDGVDVVYIYATTGSNGGSTEKLLGRFQNIDGKLTNTTQNDRGSRD